MQIKYIGIFLVVCLIKMQVGSAQVNNVHIHPVNYVLPLIVNQDKNPALGLELLNDSGKMANIDELEFELGGTLSFKEIKKIEVFISKKKGDFDTTQRFGQPQSGTKYISFKGNHSLKKYSHFWIAISFSESADIDKDLSIRCKSVSINSGKVMLPPVPSTSILRLAKAVREDGLQNVHTYRIPGLTTTNKGTLLAVYDVRHNSYKDLQGNIDIGLSRSTDGGRNWEPMRIVLDMKTWRGLPEKFNGVSDANIIVDPDNNNIFVFGLWMYGVLDTSGKFVEGLTQESESWEHQWKNKGSQPGYDVRQTSQVIFSKSIDDGLTWSKPENVTQMFKKESWWLATVAPGHGIALNNGTLVIPTQGRDEKGAPFSNITYSKDHGKTWQYSNPAYSNTTENMAVELSDGSIMLNMRHNDNRNDTQNNGRAIAITKDLGKTWVEHPGSRKDLVEPVCMASLHKHAYTENGEKKSVLLFSNPNTTKGRHHLTIKVSFDEGATWPEKYWMLLDEGKSKGYSCITSIDEKTIGILYEGSRASMTFQRILLKNLINP